MRNGIFISYRRSDTEGEASRLAEDLREKLVDVQIFRDVETISPGEVFPEALARALADCVVQLALIGPTWLDARDEDGKRRLEDPNDWVRQEIRQALASKVRVIPVTCRGAVPPKESALPSDIAMFAQRQAVEIDNNRWRYDVDQLIDRLVQSQGFKRRVMPTPGPVPGPAPVPAPAPKSGGLLKGLLIGGAVTLGALMMIGLLVESNDKEESSGGLPSDPSYSLAPAVEVPAPKKPAAPVLPAPQPAPTQPAAAPSAPNLSGIWRSNDGDVYSFQQQGSELLATVQVNGAVLGAGRGVLNGQILQLALLLTSNTQVQVNCSLQAGPNFQSFTGVCQGPGGQYPAHIYR
jgi:hypothetical protein